LDVVGATLFGHAIKNRKKKDQCKGSQRHTEKKKVMFLSIENQEKRQ